LHALQLGDAPDPRLARDHLVEAAIYGLAQRPRTEDLLDLGKLAVVDLNCGQPCGCRSFVARVCLRSTKEDPCRRGGVVKGDPLTLRVPRAESFRHALQKREPHKVVLRIALDEMREIAPSG